MKNLVALFSLLCISYTVNASLIYGVHHTSEKYLTTQYPVYVQMGNFSEKDNAQQTQHQLRLWTKAPVVITPSAGQYKVIVGPFHNSKALQKFIEQLNTKMSSETLTPIIFPESESTTTKRTILPKKLILSHYVLPQGSHPEFSIFLGNSHVPNTIEGQTLQLLPYEIGPYADTFTNQSGDNSFTWGIEAQYFFKLHESSEDNYLFNGLGVGLNFFQITNLNQTGNVLQFNMPEFENYTYSLGLNNIRIMANFNLDFHPLRYDIIPFAQAGIGSARTEITYNSVPISPVNSPNFILPSEANWHFSYQIGAGIKYQLKSSFELSLRYLYANMGSAESSIQGNSSVLAAPLKATMSTHNALFGLTYLFNN